MRSIGNIQTSKASGPKIISIVSSVINPKGSRIAVPTSEDKPALPTSSSQQTMKESSSPDDNFDPHGASGGTIAAAIFGIIKAMVGPAILYLPHSFADAGYLFALVALFICSVMYLYSSNRLLQCWHHVKSNVCTVHSDRNMSTNPKRKKSEDHQDMNNNTSNSNTKEVEMVSLVTTAGTDGHKATTSNIASAAATTTAVVRSKKLVEASPVSSFMDEDDMMDDAIKTTNSSSSKTDIASGHVSYPQLAKMAYHEYNGEAIVQVGITLMQLGVCLTYFIFVPHNMSASIYTLLHVHVPLWICLVIMVLVEIPLSSIRNIRKLVHTNVLANALIAFGLLSCLYLAIFNSSSSNEETMAELIEKDVVQVDSTMKQVEVENPGRNLAETTSEPTSTTTSRGSFNAWNDKWYLFIGTSVLLFEGSITLCLPLQEALQGQESIQKFPTVYIQTISSIVLFYSFFGMVCWISFGNDVNTVLTTSLPEGVLATIVQLAYSVAVIFTFPLQIYPAMEIIVHYVERRMGGGVIQMELTKTQRTLVVSIVVVALSIVAVVEMDNLGRVVSLMGSLLGVPLAFIFPPLIHTKIVPTAPKRKNLAVASAGLLAMIGATFTTLATWSDGGERRRLSVGW